MEELDKTKDPQHQKLLHQFNRPEPLELKGENVLTVDLLPENLKTETPTLVLPGFSATPDAIKDALIKTAEAGRRVVSPYAPHGVHSGGHPDLVNAEARKFDLLLSLMEKKSFEKVNVIAHSEAAIYVTAAAVLHPERFENIVLIEPAGLIGSDSLLRLLKRNFADMKGMAEAAKGLKPVTYVSDLSIGAKSVFSNIPASYRELQAIANSDITASLKKIHDAGVGLSIIHAVDDQVFPMERVLQLVHANMIDGFYSVQGPHGSIYLYQPFGEAAEAALTALEKKQEKENSKAQPQTPAI